MEIAQLLQAKLGKLSDWEEPGTQMSPLRVRLVRKVIYFNVYILWGNFTLLIT